MADSYELTTPLTAPERAVILALRAADPSPAPEPPAVDEADPAVLAADMHSATRRLVEQDLNRRVMAEYAAQASPVMGLELGEIRVRVEHLTIKGIRMAALGPIAPKLSIDLHGRLERANPDLDLRAPQDLLTLLGRLARAAGASFRRSELDALLRAMRVDYAEPGVLIERALADGGLQRVRRGRFWAAEAQPDADPTLFVDLLDAITTAAEENG